MAADFTLADSFRSLESQSLDWDHAETPGTITINDRDYACALDIGGITPMATENGYENRQTARVVLRKSLLATCPTRDDAFVMAGYNTWKLIAATGQNATDLAWMLTLSRRVT